ncbi:MULTISPECIES: DUF4124 domain-containing protein [Methylotenera]|uniref:DUF4124 domain-containing protein n=1 Tax=Methylotenera TaxID=359407 RepID=UPI00035F261E|nr:MULTISPECIES: DUF4124 domain-containing protein [Methylotenera]
MKLLLMISTLALSLQAHAEIFVCKNINNKITYQDEPCLDQTIRTLKNVPDAPIEDQIEAHERTRKSTELSQQRALIAETERQQQEKANREYQAIAIERRKLELLEEQSLALEQTVAPQWIIGARPGFGINRSGIYRYDTYRRNTYKPGMHKPITNKPRPYRPNTDRK